MTTPSMPLRDLFDAALALAPDERPAFLDRNCPDPEARARLERLLAAAEDDDTVTGKALPGAPADRLADAIGDIQAGHEWLPGRRIGPYLLLEILGEGGSATVFRAERDLDGVRQQVALKLLHRGLYSPEAQRLFRRERHALASLSHPNIAHLIDGGVTDGGHAYLVMEYVDGQPITQYAAQQQLGVRARLRLLALVCQAVAAAHRALIVHRDLKPSNILVADDGRVKLLDFGIAKLLGEELDEAGATRTGYAPLTPGYAAPEQYSGGAISTATDVYALGVVLHELLLGERPARQPAPRPSARVAELATDLWTLPAPRPALRAALRGDLDTIVLKALADEPARRYASAADLADDIDRHLDSQPVRAHPPSRWYRTRKFVQRHRGGVAMTAILAIAVIASLGVALWQAQLARQEARRATEQSLLAQSESRRANEVRAFIEGLFESINQGFPEDRTPDVKDLVRAGVERLRADQAFGAPERIDLLLMFARLHERLGEPDPARGLTDEAVALADSALDPLHPRAIEALALRGELAVRIGNVGQAEAPLREALRRLRASGLDSSLLHEVLETLANIETGKGNAEAALQLAQESRTERIRIFGPDSVGAAAGHNNVGVGLAGLGRFDAAAEAFRLTYEIDARHQDIDSYYVLFSLTNWATALANAGRIGEGRRRLVEVEEAFGRLGGKPRQGQIVNRQRLCGLDALFASAADAQASCAGLLEITRAYTGGEGTYMAVSLRVEATRLREAGDLAGSAALLDRAWNLLADEPVNARFRGMVLFVRASLAWLAGDEGAARIDAAAALALLDRFRDAASVSTELRALLLLACGGDGDPSACPASLAADLDASLAGARARGNGHYLLAAMLRLQSRLASGEAEAGLTALDAVLDGARDEIDAAHPHVRAARIWRAHALAVLGRCAEAELEYDQASRAADDENRANPWLGQALAQRRPDCPAG